MNKPTYVMRGRPVFNRVLCLLCGMDTSEQRPNGPKGRKPFFEQCVFLQTRVEKRVKVLLERLAGDERMKARSGTPWLGNQKQQSFGRIISVLVEEEAARLGIGVEGALLTDEQLGESRE